MEESRALLALETDAERLFQRRPHRPERRRVARRLDPRQAVAGIGGEQPRQIPRLRERGPVRQGAGEIFAEARPGRIGEGARFLQLVPEVLFAVRQPEGFEICRTPRRVLADEDEVAQVGRQHKAVAVPIAADLRTLRGQPGIVARGFDLDHAPFRRLALARPALLHLLRCVEAEIGMAGALIGKPADAEHLRLQCRAHGVQQLAERPVVRQFAGRAAGSADSGEVREIGSDRVFQFLVRSGHGRSCGRVRRRAQAPFCIAPERRVAPGGGGLWKRPALREGRRSSAPRRPSRCNGQVRAAARRTPIDLAARGHFPR